MIDLSGVTKQYGAQVLFEGASAHLGARSRCVLVGPNGSGKSTLIRMILGQEEPDLGRVSRLPHLSLGHLAQEVPRTSDKGVLEEVMRLDGRRDQLLVARRELEAALEKASAEDEASGRQAQHLERYGRVLEELEALDEYRLEARAKSILQGMGFRARDFERRLGEFSGGWLMRVALSRLLLQEPDLLLLDEPTNHLDLESLLWLEQFLLGFRGALLLVSHDTHFANRLAQEVIEIDQKKLWTYRGNLDAYMVQKAERLEVLRSQFESQQSRIAEIERFVRRFGSKATKARQAQSRLKELDRMERIELPDERDQVEFRFPPAQRSGREVVTLKGAGLSYGEKRVFSSLDWVLQRGARVAIVGPNGAGKTTLLKLLAGELEATEGVSKLGHEVKVGYYAQHQAETLDRTATIQRELENTAPELTISRVRGIAGAFLFSGDAVEKRCGVLSGGEKARVALAKLLLSPSNFLILDEPTNHLDVQSRGVLLEALQEYEGTLVVVSHDRAFMSGLVDTVLEVVPSEKGSSLVALLGGYEDYLERKNRELAQAGSSVQLAASGTSSPTQVTAADSSGSDRPAKGGVSNNTRQAWLKKREKLEKEIEKFESEIAGMDGMLASDSIYESQSKVSELLEKRRTFQEALNMRYLEWEQVSSDLEQT